MENDFSGVLNNLSRITEQMDRVTRTNQLENNIAVLWDVENVNPSADSLFLEGFLEYISHFGRLTIAQAFADWTRRHIKKMAVLLSDNHFELIHIPAARKNSSDISLITHGIELALQYQNLETFILVTGDADFRPLILSLRRNGKKIHIVCDVQNASEDLLILADSFKDYRALRPGGTTDKDDEEEKREKREKGKIAGKEKAATAERAQTTLEERRKVAFDMLVEAIKSMEEVKPGLGLVKVRLKMLNPNFDEQKLGYSSWSNFVDAAVKRGKIKVEGKGESKILGVPSSKEKRKELSDQEKIFALLKEVLRELDEKGEPKYHNFSVVAEELYKKPSFSKLKNKLGYKKFKEFIQAAEVRKLVETQVDGLNYSVRRRIK